MFRIRMPNLEETRKLECYRVGHVEVNARSVANGRTSCKPLRLKQRTNVVLEEVSCCMRNVARVCCRNPSKHLRLPVSVLMSLIASIFDGDSDGRDRALFPCLVRVFEYQFML